MVVSASSALSSERAKRVYDLWGARLDWNEFYERHAVSMLLERAELDTASSVFEFGCGTGRVAERLLEKMLPSSCRYAGVDLSDTMVELARRRLASFGDRARVDSIGCDTPLDREPGSFDRFLSTYVFDVLTPKRTESVLADAHRMLAPGGKLCLVSLWRAEAGIGRFTGWCWERIYRLSPSLLGGCRPVHLLDELPETHWRVDCHLLVAPFGLTSGIVVATRI